MWPTHTHTLRQCQCHCHSGWHKVGEKIHWVFQRLFHSHKLTVPWVVATKTKRNNDLHQRSFHINASNITGHHHWVATQVLPEIVMILFAQSTAVLHKYLNDELCRLLWYFETVLCLLQFFPEVAQNSPRVPWVFRVQRNPPVFQVFQVCGKSPCQCL